MQTLWSSSTFHSSGCPKTNFGPLKTRQALLRLIHSEFQLEPRDDIRYLIPAQCRVGLIWQQSNFKCISLRDPLQFSLLLSSKFKRTNFYSPWNQCFSDDITGNRYWPIHSNLLNIRAKFGHDPKPKESFSQEECINKHMLKAWISLTKPI